MTDDQFWKIINVACGQNPRETERWDDLLVGKLAQLPPDGIIAWDRMFDRLTNQAYRMDLWAAAYLINGGASDDGFYYFRCWLVGMGRQVYDAAIAEPDSLANVVSAKWQVEGIDAEAEIYGAGRQAWMRVTGNTDTAEYPVQNEHAELVGEDWDFENDNLMSKHLPRLAAMYHD